MKEMSSLDTSEDWDKKLSLVQYQDSGDGDRKN